MKDKAKVVFRLSESPYYLDEIRSLWKDNDERRHTGVYDA